MKKRTYVLIVAICITLSQISFVSPVFAEEVGIVPEYEIPFISTYDYDDDYYDDDDYFYSIGETIGENFADGIFGMLIDTMNAAYAMIPTCDCFLSKFGDYLHPSFSFLNDELRNMAGYGSYNWADGLQYTVGQDFSFTIFGYEDNPYLKKVEISTKKGSDYFLMFCDSMMCTARKLTLEDNETKFHNVWEKIENELKFDEILDGTYSDTKASYTKNAFKYTFERDDQDGFKFTAENIFN